MSDETPLIASTDNLPRSVDDHEVAKFEASKNIQVSALRGSVISASFFFLLFLCTCNISALTTIQSPIAIDLHATTETSWFTSTFLISIASVTAIAGRLCQVFTLRWYLLASTILSAAGLLVTAASTSIPTFLGGRAIHGVGVAAVGPTALLLITEFVSIKRRGLFFGLLNCGFTTGVACGAIIAGALEPIVGWRACYWLQVPFILLLAGVTFFSIPKPAEKDAMIDDLETSTAQKLSRLDFLGIFTLISAVLLLLFSLSSPQIQVLPIILSIFMFALFLLVEHKWASEPLVPPAVLQSRGAMLTGLATVGVMCARWAVLFYIPIYGIAVRGWAPARAGALLIPTNAGFGLGGVVAGWLHIRRARSYYVSCLLCFLLFAAVHTAVGALSIPHSSLVLYVIIIFSNGFIMGALLTYSLAHMLHVTETKHHVIIIPINFMFRNLSGAFGSAVEGGIFVRALRRSLQAGFQKVGMTDKAELVNELLGRPMLVQKLYGVEKDVAMDGYVKAIQTVYFIGAAIALVMTLVQSGTGWTAPGADKSRRAENDVSALRED